jgi:CDP-diacylglycerol--glycerol-3-phosphate 3-phosphatidyltransferase
MSIYDLKPRFQALLRPLVGRLAGVGVTANQVTLAAAVGSGAVGVAVALGPLPRILLLLPAWLFVRMALNAVDGMLAREFGQKSDRGAVLNEVGDVVSDTALYLPLGVLPGALWPAVGFTLLAALTEFCGVLGQALGAGRQYQGPMGKSDRAFAVGALGLVCGLHAPAVAAWPIALSAAALLAGATSVRRCQAALAALRVRG